MSEENRGTMSLITIEKQALLGKLKENLGDHDTLLEETTEEYWKQLALDLDKKKKSFHKKIKEYIKDFNSECKRVAKAIADRDDEAASFNRFDSFYYCLDFELPKPKDHSEDYKTAINMVEYDVHSNFALKTEEFNKYVLNKWDWAVQFKNTSQYLLSSGAVGIGNANPTGYVNIKAFNALNKF